MALFLINNNLQGIKGWRIYQVSYQSFGVSNMLASFLVYSESITHACASILVPSFFVPLMFLLLCVCFFAPQFLLSQVVVNY